VFFVSTQLTGYYHYYIKLKLLLLKLLCC